MNHASKKPYRGVNTFLWPSRDHGGQTRNYGRRSSRFKPLGGNVKGQHSETVCSGNCCPKNPTRIREGQLTTKLFRRFVITVFHLYRSRRGIKKPVAETCRSSSPSKRRKTWQRSIKAIEAMHAVQGRTINRHPIGYGCPRSRPLTEPRVSLNALPRIYP